jgi:TctA family transporter
MDFFFYALVWATLAILVGQYAKRRQRDERNWAALAFLISPVLAFVILMAMERASNSATRA